MKGKLLVISGPSAGVGKDTILKMFLEKQPNWQRITTTITRPARRGEVDGVDYNFVSDEQFKQRQAEGRFLETDFHAGYWYGTPRQDVEELLTAGQNIVLRIDVNGTMELKKQLPEAITVYLDAETDEVLESRIRARSLESGETEEDIKERLNLAKKESALKSKFDYIVINPEGHPEKALAEIEKILSL